MLLANRKPGQCIFCALRALDRRPIALSSQRPHGLRHRSGRSAKKTPKTPKALERVLVEGVYADKEDIMPMIPFNSTKHVNLSKSGFQFRSPGEKRTPRSIPVRQIPEKGQGVKIIHRPPQKGEMMGFRKMDLSSPTSAVDRFEQVLAEKWNMIEKELLRDDLETEYWGPGSAWGINSKEELDDRIEEFKKRIQNCLQLAREDAMKGKVPTKDKNPLFDSLRLAFVQGGMKVLQSEMKYSFLGAGFRLDFSKQAEENQKEIADMRYPMEWYPATRALQRTIHLHIGPTNSGKTYHALQRLEQAKTGIYAGPLRLLAHEVYSRFNAKGKLCALITGEDRRVPEGLDHVMHSCTVEMVPLQERIDVAVIDEIQMLGDRWRGWAWTQAFLGLQAKEVHLCGEARTRQVIENLCKEMGEKLIVHEYERLSPLKVEKQSLRGDLTKLRKGDAIILFSRVAIHAMRAEVEKITGKRCAVVYGSLPPETRAQQAALFNDPNNDYDFLVASDAVGMGLNLSIKRVIFEATAKHNGSSFASISNSDIKQIGGRAGRFKSASAAIQEGSSSTLVQISQKNTGGLITTLDEADLKVVRAGINSNINQITRIGLQPTSEAIMKFANYFPTGTPWSSILLRLRDLAKLDPRFFMCESYMDKAIAADIVQQHDLTATERLIITNAPAQLKQGSERSILAEFAGCISRKSGNLVDMKSLNLELIDTPTDLYKGGPKAYLKALESLHKSLTLYLWLSYRYAGVFLSQKLCFHVKDLVEQRIDMCLAGVHWDKDQREWQKKKMRKQQQKKKPEEEEALMRGLEREETIGDEGKSEETVGTVGTVGTDEDLEDLEVEDMKLDFDHPIVLDEYKGTVVGIEDVKSDTEASVSIPSQEPPEEEEPLKESGSG